MIGIDFLKIIFFFYLWFY